MPSTPTGLIGEQLIQYHLDHAVNELHKLVLIATWLDKATRKMEREAKPIPQCNQWLAPVPQYETLPATETRRCRTIEQAGVLGMYDHMNAANSFDFLFGNDWYVSQGYDALVLDKANGDLVICEAKATTRPLKHALSYLALTKSRGWQLSWEWCWKVGTEYARNGAVARVFLELFPRLLDRHKVRRALYVVQVRQGARGFEPVSTQLIDEAELCKDVRFMRPVALDPQRLMFTELKKRGLWPPSPRTYDPSAWIECC